MRNRFTVKSSVKLILKCSAAVFYDGSYFIKVTNRFVLPELQPLSGIVHHLNAFFA